MLRRLSRLLSTAPVAVTVSPSVVSGEPTAGIERPVALPGPIVPAPERRVGRLPFLLRLVALGLGISSALRAVILAVFAASPLPLPSFLACLALGLLLDALTAGVLLAPLGSLLALAPAGWLSRRWLRAPLVALFFTGAVFLAFTEYFFFEEFLSRFNHVALDYLLFPTEVFTNLGESYDIPLFASLALLAGALFALLLERSLRGSAFVRLGWRARLAGLGRSWGTGALAFALLWSLPWKVRADRIEDEAAHNGLCGLVHAYATATLDYPTFYLSVPEEEAEARVAARLGVPVAGVGPGLQRPFRPRASAVPPPHQVVVIVEESFGSEFVGVLGHPELELTPHFDRWSREGLLLTRLVPTGNRTVRGLEAVLTSFVPLPGDAILRREKSGDVATLGRVFAANDFRTVFLYGGRSVFDSMSSFLGDNGWSEFVEQPDYPEGAFHTAWGVADEFIFDALLARQERAREQGEKLFATLLSVSNHKPYDVPLDDAHVASVHQGRRRAVAYSDYALGRYLDQARERGLLEDSLILIVGDHGARVYGSSEIPAASYRVPGLFLSNDPAWRGRRIERLCSQIDLGPTLLSLAGIACRAPFFGQDLLDLPARGGRAFLQHNRDVGILTDELLVVLGLHKRVAFYGRGGPESDEFRLLDPAEVGAEAHALALDAAATYQTAQALYDAGLYRIAPDPADAGGVSGSR